MAHRKACIMLCGGAYSKAEELEDFGNKLKDLVPNSKLYVTTPGDIVPGAKWYAE